MTEVLDLNDERATSHEMNAAKRKEIRNPLQRGTFNVVLKEDISRDSSVVPERVFMAIKSTKDDLTKFKARYDVGGHGDKLMDLMVHYSCTLEPNSIRLLLSFDAMSHFDFWTSDLRQTYLKSAIPLNREIFIRKPVPEFYLHQNNIFCFWSPYTAFETLVISGTVL